MRFMIGLVTLILFTVLLQANSFLEKEQKIALQEKKLILLSVASKNCPYCIKMKQDIFMNKKYQKKISKNYLHVEIMNDDPRLFPYLHVMYLPTNYILSPRNLTIIDEFAGYTNPDHFIELLDEVYLQEVKLFSKPLPLQKQIE